MHPFARLKIRTKLNLLVAFACLLLTGAGAIGLAAIQSSKNALYHVYNDHLVAINQLNEIRNHQMQIRLELFAARLEADAFEVLGHADKVRSHVFQIENLLQAYTSRALGAEEKQRYDAFIAARTHFGTAGVFPMIDLLQGENHAEADRLRQETLEPAYAKASQGIDELIHYQVEQARLAYDKVAAFTRNIIIATVGGILGAVLLMAVSGLFLTRSIGKGVSALQEATGRLANGDLTARAQLEQQDEIGEMARSFNRMAEDFTTLIGQMRESADHVSNACGTVTTMTEKVSQASGTQAEEASVAAVAVEQMNASLQDVARKGGEAVAAATEAGKLSAHGKQVVSSAVAGIRQVADTVAESSRSIESLGQRSDEIGRIIQVIDDIANQTNLLALNAAIEAARAGEQGRGFAVVAAEVRKLAERSQVAAGEIGFAVVADEVRKLAEKTSAATTEISSMIAAIQADTASAVSSMERGGEQVREGVEQANQAGDALNQIYGSVENVVGLIRQIAEAMNVQKSASEEISQRVEHIADSARESGAAITEATAAFHQMHGLAGQLQESVGRFRLG